MSFSNIFLLSLTNTVTETPGDGCRGRRGRWRQCQLWRICLDAVQGGKYFEQLLHGSTVKYGSKEISFQKWIFHYTFHKLSVSLKLTPCWCLNFITKGNKDIITHRVINLCRLLVRLPDLKILSEHRTMHTGLKLIHYYWQHQNPQHFYFNPCWCYLKMGNINKCFPPEKVSQSQRMPVLHEFEIFRGRHLVRTYICKYIWISWICMYSQLSECFGTSSSM